MLTGENPYLGATIARTEGITLGTFDTGIGAGTNGSWTACG